MDAGELVGGRYRLVERLGEGGMSVVWRAVDELLQRDVAVKVLASTVPAELLEQVHREARMAAQVYHPHVVDVYDFGSGPPAPYLVMELVPGRSLATLLADGGLPPRQAMTVVAEIAAALAAAHARGVVHRDVTPANVLVGASGTKLVDFGISAVEGRADEVPAGTVLGTPAYLAPERIRGKPAGPASDVYALGLVLYRGLAGRLPWDATTPAQMVKAHCFVEPEPLAAPPGVPPRVIDLCFGCLEKDPSRRPAAAEVADVLAAAAAVAAVAGPAPVTQPGPGRPASVEARALAATVAVTTSLAGGRGRLPRPVRLGAALGSLVLLIGATVVHNGRGGLAPATQALGPGGAGVGANTRSCRVHYDLWSDREDRFTAAVTVVNTGTEPVASWRLDFSFGADQRVDRTWGAAWTQTGREVTVAGAQLPAGGSAVTGFDGKDPDLDAVPAGFRLDGVACEAVITVDGRPLAGGVDDDDNDAKSKGGKGRGGKGDG